MSNRFRIYGLLRKLWASLHARRQRQLRFLFILMVVTSFAEMFGIGALVPFLGVILDPEAVYKSDVFEPILRFMNINSPESLLLPVTIGFICVVAIVAALRILLLWISTRLSFSIGLDLSYDIYDMELRRPYSHQISQNSSEVINAIITQTNIITNNVVVPTVTILTNVLLVAGIVVALFLIEPYLTLATVLGFLCIYVAIAFFTQSQLKKNGITIAQESRAVVKHIQEGLGGIRDIIIDGSYKRFTHQYHLADKRLRFAYSDNHFLGQAPRFVVEGLSMVLIAGIAVIFSSRENMLGLITSLGVVALGGQKALPLVQRVYLGWANIRGGEQTLKDVLSRLDKKTRTSQSVQKISFNTRIDFDKVDFSYEPGKAPVLRNINLSIDLGSRIGLVGPTGSGKSTFTDLLMGLLQPTVGKIRIDGTPITDENISAWRKHVAHVPQEIYLADCSIRENIAFGVDPQDIDNERVTRAAKLANIDSLVDSWDDKYDTVVGERGARLSGGQRQRIGIARALYREAQILVLDEVTSALDSATEQEILQSLSQLDDGITLILISHRNSNLVLCKTVFRFDGTGNIEITNRSDSEKLI
jgi:ABC-type multidrug transport system fused ATPase/permease subunit